MLFSKPDKRKTDFLLRHPEMAIAYISRNYPFSFDELKQYQNDVNWHYISLNCYVEWSYELIDYFVSMLDFNETETMYEPGFFCINHGLPWSVELIKRYEHLWNWNFLMINSKLIKIKEIYDYMKKTYKEYTTDNDINNLLRLMEKGINNNYDNYQRCYDLEIVLDYIIKNSVSLHQNWDEVEADPNPDWDTISRNVALDWREQNIEKYKNNINFRVLCSNIAVPWSVELLKKYMYFFKNGNSIKVDNQTNNCDFMSILCFNRYFPWNMQTITEFEDIVDFDSLSSNPYLDWNIDLLLKYEGKWEYYYFRETRTIIPKAFAEMQDKEVMIEFLEMLLKDKKNE